MKQKFCVILKLNTVIIPETLRTVQQKLHFVLTSCLKYRSTTDFNYIHKPS